MFYYLPQALIRIKGEYAKKEDTAGYFIITVSSVYAADPRHRYYLEPGTNPFYDDEFKIHTNGKGLLETVNVVAEDKTADILGDIASIVGSAVKFGAGLSPALAAPPSRQPFDFTFSPDEVDKIDDYLRPKGFDLEHLKAEAKGADATGFSFAGKGKNQAKSPARQGVRALFSDRSFHTASSSRIAPPVAAENLPFDIAPPFSFPMIRRSLSSS